MPAIHWFVTAAILIHNAPSGWVYPPECCGGRDCKPVACEELTETKDGVKYKSYTFTKGQIRPSQDGECHVCTWESVYGIQGWCVFILPSS